MGSLRILAIHGVMRVKALHIALVWGASLAWGAAPSGRWDTFNLAPASRVVRPTAVKEVHGSIQNPHGLVTSNGRATLSGNESWLTLDFGKEVRNAPRSYHSHY